MYKNAPKIVVNNEDSYIDEELDIHVIGCKPRELVTLRAKMADDDGKVFKSFAMFEVDAEGSLSLSHAKPLKGSYNGINGTGLFWSMELANSKQDDFFMKMNAEKISAEIMLEVSGQIVDTVLVNRYFYNDDVIKEAINNENLTGVLFYPKREGTYPGVLLLGGSDGGYLKHAAAHLSSQGFAVLSLAYFGVGHVPDNLENIPLEYFQEATRWLVGQSFVDGKISVIGFSRGGELALLLGATYDEYEAVIAVSPSAYVTAGMKNNIFAPIPSWTQNKEALPYMKFVYRPSIFFSMLRNWILKRPVSYLSIWDQSLRNLAKLEDSRIPVEKIKAPIMTIAGTDDQLWPSAYFTRLIDKQLTEENFTYERLHIYYEGAGHFLSFPYNYSGLPANVVMQVGGGMTMTFGGTKYRNAMAVKDSWPKILDFIKQSDKKKEVSL